MRKTGKRSRIAAAICAFLAVLTAAFILYNGAQQPEQSNARSNAVAQQVQTVIHTENTPSALNSLAVFVRKSAHVLEYALFGFLCALTVAAWHHAGGKLYGGTAAAVIFAVATADEYIQSFVNRTGLVRDIVLDICGSAAGVLIAAAVSLLLAALRRRHLSAKRERDDTLE